MSSDDDEAFLELEADGPAAPAVDPTPHLPEARDDEAFLELDEVAPGALARAVRVVSDDDLRTVTALAEDDRPLLDALYPAQPDLAARPPTAAELSERLAFVRAALNQVTRRGSEWRARAEVAGSVLARRLDGLQRGGDLAGAALAELLAWHERAIEALVTREAGDARALFPAEIQRLDAEAARRGLPGDVARAVAARLGVSLHSDVSVAWSACDALPGSPRTLDAAADAIAASVAHAVVALRDGALSAWLRVNRADPALVSVAEESEALARNADTDAAVIGAWTLAWAMGREGVAVDGLPVTSPEVLRTHLRAGRLDPSRVRAQGRALGGWFRREGHGAAAAACEALARDDAHAALRLSWALGEPLRVAAKPVADPTALAREVLRRPEARAEALDRWRDGSLLAWMDALPRARRDAAWTDELAASRAHAADEGAFWRGVYRRAPRASLRVFVEVGAATRAVRFEGIGDLRSTARAAAAWGALRDAHLRGELHAWLAQAAPGMELDPPPAAADDGALLRLLWSLGATGLVLGRGAAGVAVDAPADLVLAWRRGPAVLEAALALGLVGEWLRRFHAQEGVPGFSVGDALARWGPGLGAGAAPSGVAALRCALLCGLTVIPSDPAASGGPDGRALVGFVGVDPARRDDGVWTELLDAPGDPLTHGTALLWAARHAPALGVLAAAGSTVTREAVRDALLAAGRPVPSAPLAETLADQAAQAARRARQRELLEESERIAAQREAARSQLAQEAARVAAERQAAQRAAARDALRREVDREVARIEAEREAARLSHARALAAMQAERALAEAEHARAMTELSLSRARADDPAATVDAEALEARWRAAARAAAEQEATQALARSEAELREAALRAAERAAAAEVQRAAEGLAAERARRERAAAELTATLGELLTREAELRAEAERAAAEATRLALSLAEGETGRVEAERAAEASARRADAAREARVAAEWAEQQAAAEAEIEALSGMERARRAEATSLGREPVEARAGATDEPAVDEGFTEDPTAEAADDVGEELLTSDRHEVAHDRLAVAYEGVDDAALSGLRDAVDAWSRARPRHPLAALGAAMVVDAVTMIPAFEVHVATRLESRAVARRVVSVDEHEDAVEVGPEAAAAGDDALDPWLLELAPVDTWDRLTVDAPLALRPRREPCPRCTDGPSARCPRGRLRCEVCDGAGTVVCARCGGYGRARCGRCGGNGEVLVPGGGTRRCPACEGRGDVSCGQCSIGRVACRACEGEGHTPCATCGADGVVETRPWVSQSVLGVRARAVVAVGLPEAIAAEVGVSGSEAAPVVHIEADAVDPSALARELPHDHLGAALADLLAAESARAAPGQRVVRQQVVAWRYPAWRLQVRVEGEPFTLWVHGARRQVWAGRSPLDAATEAAVAAVRAFVAADSLDAAIDRLVALAAEDPGHPGARDAATALGGAVLAMAERGELYEAQRLAGRGAALRWPDAMSQLVQAERVAGRRLNQRSSWALVEDARAALDRGLDGRALDLLRELHAAAPDDDDGAALADALGRRLDAQASALVARGALDDAAALLSRAGAVGFASLGAALAGSSAALRRARRRARQRAVAAVVIALLLVAAAARALLR